MSQSTIGRPLLRFVARERFWMEVGCISMRPQPFEEVGQGVGVLQSKDLGCRGGYRLVAFCGVQGE
jgi:hypothetical protein